MGYHWFDVPAYEDLDRKLWMTLKFSSVAGFSAGAYRNIVLGIPRTALEVVVPIASTTAFFVGSALSGCIGVWASAKLREKDDIWNYVVGGLAISGFWGIKTKNFSKFVTISILSVPTCMFIKATHNRDDNGETFYVYRYPRVSYGGSAWGYQSRIGMSPGRDPGIIDRGSRF